jgi:hypothetical protein
MDLLDVFSPDYHRRRIGPAGKVGQTIRINPNPQNHPIPPLPIGMAERTVESNPKRLFGSSVRIDRHARPVVEAGGRMVR